MNRTEVFDRKIPGSDIVAQGLEDIRGGKITAYALFLQVAAPRLRRLAIEVPALPGAKNPSEVLYEQQLYDLVEGAGGHGLYNALCKRISSFASAVEASR